jgi:hypothetical protein
MSEKIIIFICFSASGFSCSGRCTKEDVELGLISPALIEFFLLTVLYSSFSLPS